jgi:hypothetical protein
MGAACLGSSVLPLLRTISHYAFDFVVPPDDSPPKSIDLSLDEFAGPEPGLPELESSVGLLDPASATETVEVPPLDSNRCSALTNTRWFSSVAKSNSSPSAAAADTASARKRKLAAL